ncbi:MAG: hypothetical protein ACI9WU_002694 [Myxococcota bacterium]|jgi:hypothetical protein
MRWNAPLPLLSTLLLLNPLVGCASGLTAEVSADTSVSAATDTAEQPDSATPSEDTTAEPAIEPLAPPAEGKGFQVTMEAVAPPYEEIWVCDVYAMPIETIAAVNRVEVQQTEGTHHLTLSTLGLSSAGKVPHGRYDCNDLYGDSTLMEEQIMFYGNQGSASDVMQLPEGVAATLPSTIDVIHEMHFVNASAKPVDVFSRLNAYTIELDEVVTGIWGGSVRDEYINIPANATHSEWTRCVMNTDVEVLFLASHTHQLGVQFDVRRFDGTEVGDIMYTNDDWHIPLITQYDPPMIVPKGQGFEWTCTWDNYTDSPINYGNASTDEMCNLAVVFTPFDMGAFCEVVQSSDGVLWKQGE